MIWDDAKAVAFDFETSGELPEYALQPWRLKQGLFWTTSISVIQRADNKLAPWMSKLFPTVDDMRCFLETAVANDWLVVTWNGIFDIAILIACGLRDLVYQARWLDGMLLWKHLDIDPEYDVDKAKKRSYALKPDAVMRFIPDFADNKGSDDVDFHSRDPGELAKLQHYNNRDSVRTLVIAKIIWDQLTEKQRAAALIEAEAIPMIAEANLHGMPIDTIFTSELSAWLKGTAEKRLEELAPHGLNGPAMVRSPKQLAELIYDTWGLPVLKENTGKKTGKVSRSTDKEVLYELAFMDPRCKLLKEYRESLNNDTKFSQAPLISAEYNGDGRTRPQGIMFGTYTGRMTYASKQGRNKDTRQIGFALHQEKRGSEFRGIIQAPPGYTIVEFDAAGQEFRWMAILSGDPNMMQLCVPGEDMHAFMGARIVGKDYRYLQQASKVKDSQEEKDRYLGKVANLCIAEGTTILTDRGPCSIEQVRDDDLVWDGQEFVAHDGVQLSGVFPVISYMGVTATLDHKVLLTNGRWETIEAAARHDWQIESALGQGWTRRGRSTLRIVDGLVRRAIRERRRTLRPRPLWPDQQRWSLRAWKLALGYARGEPCQSRAVRTYDIVNCGPRTRFAANGLIVHNSLQYRTYPKTFRKVARVQYDIPMELPEAQRIHRTYQSTYTMVPKYWDRQIQLVKQLGYAETLAGRRVAVIGNWGGSLSWKMESTSLNYPVQGTGGDQKYLALRVLKDFIIPLGGYFAWDLHDGLYWFIPDEKVDRVVVEGKHLLDNLPYQEAWGFTPPIPLPWDNKYGKVWGALKEHKG